LEIGRVFVHQAGKWREWAFAGAVGIWGLLAWVVFAYLGGLPRLSELGSAANLALPEQPCCTPAVVRKFSRLREARSVTRSLRPRLPGALTGPPIGPEQLSTLDGMVSVDRVCLMESAAVPGPWVAMRSAGKGSVRGCVLSGAVGVAVARGPRVTYSRMLVWVGLVCARLVRINHIWLGSALGCAWCG